MSELKIMPLRFKVWDKKEKSFCTGAKTDDRIFDLIELSVFLTRHAEKGRPHTDFEFCQDAGYEDDKDQKLYFGDIISYVTEHGEIGTGYLTSFHGDTVAKEGGYIVSMRRIAERLKIGNIFENPDLLGVEDDDTCAQERV